MPPSSKNLIPWIQSLRGLAALLVVYTHARYFLPGDAGQTIAQEILRPAAMGVDLFFLLSGFIMVLTTRNNDSTKLYAWDFLIKRFARIWPLYAAVSVVVFLGVFGPGHPSYGTTFSSFLDSLLFIPIDPKVALTFGMPVSVAWTLCFEFYFYLVFGASMLFGRWRWLAMAVWFGSTLVIYPLVAGVFSMQVLGQRPIESLRYANIAVNPIVWEFILGMLAGWLYCSNFRIKSVQWLRLAVFASLATVVWASYSGLVNMHGPAGWGGPLFLLMISLTLLSKEEEIALPEWTVWLGGISYSLYLTHLIAFSLTSRAVALIGLPDPAKVAIGHFILAPAVAIVMAALVYAAVETPLSNWTRSTLLGIRPNKRSGRLATGATQAN